MPLQCFLGLRLVRHTALACLFAAGAAGAAGCSATSPPPGGDTAGESSAQSTPKSAGETGTGTARETATSREVTKVLVFVVENHSLSQMKAGMPYTFGLAQRYGYATSHTAVGHPSLPNYIAIAGGQTYGITSNQPPAASPVRGTSVFGQALASGRTAAVYADGMPGSCATTDGGTGYAVRHNPWPYFVNERDACRRYDVPVDRLGAAIGQGTLPNVGMVIPNLCNDAHDCALGTADDWFRGWMTKLFHGPDWRSGHLAVVLTADEDDGSQENKVLTVVIHPSQRSNVVTSPLTHYSLTRLFEEVAGTPYLFGAASAPSMSAAFGLRLR